MQNYVKTWSQAQSLEMTVLGVVWTVPASLVEELEHYRELMERHHHMGKGGEPTLRNQASKFTHVCKAFRFLAARTTGRT